MNDFVLNKAEVHALFIQDPDTKKDGGYQSLLVSLQQKIDRATGQLQLNDSDLRRIPQYAFDYGNGGWEDRLVAIFGRVLGARLGRQPSESPSPS
ncbi:MAG: hypothetical protein P4L99_05745 [Chthoniobacter sp.]|nr:hypothetical protein [Chthoniobacter sp.]